MIVIVINSNLQKKNKQVIVRFINKQIIIMFTITLVINNFNQLLNYYFIQILIEIIIIAKVCYFKNIALIIKNCYNH